MTEFFSFGPKCHGSVFFCSEEKYVSAEPWLVQDTTQAELDYIAAKAVEAELAKEASSTGGAGLEAG